MKQALGFVICVGLAAGVALPTPVVTAKPASANQANGSNQGAATTAAATFKNLHVLGDLKGAPSSELWDTMQVFAGSLSVSCN